MAESFLFSIAEKVLDKIASSVLQEINLAWDLNRNLRKFEQTLITIKAVLLDAEEHQSHNHELQLWLWRLKILCYDADDILDELEYHALHNQVLQLYGNPIKDKVNNFFSSSNFIALRFNIGHRLEELNERLDDIADQKSKFHLTELVEYRLVGRQQREMTDSLLRTSNVIGRDDDKEIVLKFLMNTDNMGNNRSVGVIPIVGMGGMGKTALAKLLYNDARVDEYFHLKIWISVPEEFDKKTLMVNMIKSLTNQNLSNLDPDQLQTIIQDKLDDKKLLLILDDVWSDDRYKWLDFKDLLEGCALGSKVIVTTRNLSVATIVGTTPAYNLKGLSHADCLSILKKWAFRGEEESYPHLNKIGNEIVKKCGGLPLAVRTLGTLLYSKIDEHYWKFIRDNEIWKSEQKETDVLPALRLSYDQMPSHLKSCFVVCSMYPKGYKFDTVVLGHAWMAHGLLRASNEHEDMDDTASQYVKELHSRSFFQDLNDYGNLFDEFTMHNLMHDLALYLAQTETSLVTIANNNISDGTRHIVISDKDCLHQKIPNYLCRENNLRTLIFPAGAEGPTVASFLNTSISNSKYLRMLSLSECSFELLPSSIGSLKHLRYLDLSCNKRLRRLPNSICKLHNMLALSVYDCTELEELPRKIRNLINLRALEISVKQKYLQEDGIWCLTTLRFVRINNCPSLKFLFEGIQSLTSLRTLAIEDCKSLVSLSQNLRCLTALEILHIEGCHQLKWMEEEDDNQDIKLSLETLTLVDLPQLETLPRWVYKYSKTLQKLFILGCENLSSMPSWLHDFTKLKSLVIAGCSTLRAWDEFSLMVKDGNRDIKLSLETLTFSNLPLLESLPLWVKKYSKTLRKLKILDCKSFSSIPEWLQDFTFLNTLIIGGCTALRKRCQKDNGKDWYKIAHVTNMYIRDRVDELDLTMRQLI